MGRPRVLCVGYFGKDNIGDDLFQSTITELWPQIDFTFTDTLREATLAFQGIWFGPGEILDDESILGGVTSVIPEMPVAFLGVGFDPDRISKTWKKLLAQAKFVVVREKRCGKAGYYLMPDLAYASSVVKFMNAPTDKKRTVILLNENFSPHSGEEQWKVKGWDWFVHEFAQFCDALREKGRELQFLPMQVSPQKDDRFPAAAVISRMRNRQDGVWFYPSPEPDLGGLVSCISQAECVISARLHGCVLATMLGVPFVPLIGHDKMRAFIDEIHFQIFKTAQFYGVRKNELLCAWEQARVGETQSMIEMSLEAREVWKSTAGSLADKFFS